MLGRLRAAESRKSCAFAMPKATNDELIYCARCSGTGSGKCAGPFCTACDGWGKLFDKPISK